jgi:hypothetical protein
MLFLNQVQSKIDLASLDFENLFNSKLDYLSKLKDGWHFGSGVPISADVIEFAKRIFKFSKEQGFLDIEMFPAQDGSLALVFYSLSDEHYFRIYKSGKIVYWVEGSEAPFSFSEKKTISPITIFSVLKTIFEATLSCKSSGSYTPAIIAGRKSVFLQWLSMPPTRGYQYFPVNAQATPVAEFVNTLENSILPESVNRQFSGFSHRQNYLRKAI